MAVKNKEVLNPTDVHYLVGLLTKNVEGSDVEVILGDMIQDEATDKERDIDITITRKNPDDTISVFKGFEVKNHTEPLDVIHVEQLCMKFEDMPSIVEKSIVSTSGYTKSAIKKAKKHDVALLEIVDWPHPRNEFQHIEFRDNFVFQLETDEEIMPKFKILRKISNSESIAGCALFEHHNGNLMGISVSNSHRNIIFLNVPIADRIKNRIYKQKLS